MKPTIQYLSVILSVIGLFTTPSATSPTTYLRLRNDGVSKRRSVAGGIIGLALAIHDWLQKDNAYDPGVKDACTLYMETTAGANCRVILSCHDNSPEREFPPWNVCYLNGRQFFNDPRIGDFSITFTKAGGVDGDTKDGLHSPILQLADVSNWDPIDVQHYADQGNNNQGGGNLCAGGSGPAGTQRLGWQCGVPVAGKKGFGLDSNTVNNNGGFKSGWCGFHVKQYQKPDPSKDHYKFDVVIKDAKGENIGQLLNADATNPISVDSRLPLPLIVTAGNVDSDAVLFNYGDQAFGSNDQAHHCDFGAYDHGARNGDCGFTC